MTFGGDAGELTTLRLQAEWGGGPYGVMDVLGTREDSYPPAMRQLVLERDESTCRFCGFRENDYHRLACLGDNPFDSAAMSMACLFCWSAMSLDHVARMRSGVMLHLPEFSQSDVVKIARDLYIWRVSPGPGSTEAKRLLDAMMTRRQACREQFGSDDPAQICRQVSDGALDIGQAYESGLRLFPLDRLIVARSGMERNQFPQILLNWRQLADYRMMSVAEGLLQQVARTIGSEEPRLRLAELSRNGALALNPSAVDLLEGQAVPPAVAAATLLDVVADRLARLAREIAPLARRKDEIESWKLSAWFADDPDTAKLLDRLNAASALLLKLAAHNHRKRASLSFAAYALTLIAASVNPPREA